MTSASETFTGLPLDQALREILRRRLTGRFEIAAAGEVIRLYFVGGELYLSPRHPLAARLEHWTADRSGGEESARDRATSDERRLDDVTEEIKPPRTRELAAAFLAAIPEWREAECTFEEGTRFISWDLLGPFPTASLLMECWVEGCDETQLLRKLGGDEARYVARQPLASLKTPPDLDPHEAFFLSRLESPGSLKDVLRQADLERREALERLCRLQAVELIGPEGEFEEEVEVASAQRDAASLLFERIADSLERRPVEISPEEHRARLKRLLGRLDSSNHFGLLGVGFESSEEEIHGAYTELARLTHPRHSESLGLEGREAGLYLLFDRITEAYLVLSDPERSRRYRAEIGDEPTSRTGDVETDARSDEKKHVARRNFNIAHGMVARQEYHSAVELLHQVLRTDPQPEYWALLGECQLRNPNWLAKATVSFSEAVQLRPRDAQLRLKLAQAYEKVGNLRRASEEYEAALELMPVLTEAIEGRARITAGRGGRGRKGVLDRLRELFRR